MPFCGSSQSGRGWSDRPGKLSEDMLRKDQSLGPQGGCGLFMSLSSPYKPVVSSTIAGWIKRLLGSSGVDTSIWKANSTRGASTSKASSVGVSISTILESANWASAGTFKKFYKPIESSSQDFQKKVLRGKMALSKQC